MGWLGEIPTHWEVKGTKFAATLRSGHTPSRQKPEYWKDCTIPWFGLADVWQIRDGQLEYVHATAEKISELGLANSAARLLPKGTVILSRTASVGFSAILGVDMATTQDFVNWVCGRSLQPEYLLYVFRGMGPEFQRLAMGSTHQTIYMPDVGRLSTPVPPVPEQDQIIAFIRKETAKIDGLVADKERLVELLQEKRTALITSAVTRGLDPNVPMKDSGVEWLGEIPAHWEVKRTKFAATLRSGAHAQPTETRVLEGLHDSVVWPRRRLANPRRAGRTRARDSREDQRNWLGELCREAPPEGHRDSVTHWPQLGSRQSLALIWRLHRTSSTGFVGHP